jgi:hydrogenase-4 component F
MLAYSSVEHMGILALGIGLGGAAGAGALLHALNHSLAKGALFLVAGNILAAYRSKNVGDARGLLGVLPASGLLWLVGILAVTGSPPFGLFVSELMILKGALAGGRFAVAGGYLAALFVAFGAIIWAGMQMAYGRPQTRPDLPKPAAESALSVAVPAILAAGVLLLGVWVPPPLWKIIHAAAGALAGGF